MNNFNNIQNGMPPYIVAGNPSWTPPPQQQPWLMTPGARPQPPIDFNTWATNFNKSLNPYGPVPQIPIGLINAARAQNMSLNQYMTHLANTPIPDSMPQKNVSAQQNYYHPGVILAALGHLSQLMS